MRRYLKSAIVVELLVLIAALVFLLAFLGFDLGQRRPFLNVSLVFAGVLSVGMLLAILWNRILLREAMVRRFYVADEWIYNHEIGYAPLERIAPDGDVFGFVTFAANALARMSYGFEIADPPTSFDPYYIIESNVFLFHASEDAPDDPDEGVIIDEWRGVLSRIDEPGAGDAGHTKVGSFSNAGELAYLLEVHGALESQGQ